MQVGPRPVWKDAHHPFRTDRQIQLAEIPTLTHYTEESLDDARMSSRLERAQVPAEAEALAQSCIAKTGQSNRHSKSHSV